MPVTKQPSAPPRHRASGFTLVELMIVVAIIGVIAAFGYPSYRNYVLEAKRVDAQTLLMEVAARQERFYADNRAYATTAKSTLGYDDANVKSGDGNWTASVDATASGAANQAFVIVASPAGDYAGDDPDCAFMGINDKGQKGGGKTKAKMNEWTPAPCWSK